MTLHRIFGCPPANLDKIAVDGLVATKCRYCGRVCKTTNPAAWPADEAFASVNRDALPAPPLSGLQRMAAEAQAEMDAPITDAVNWARRKR